MTGARRRIARLGACAVLVVPAVLSLSLASLAAPSADEVAAAKDELVRLQHEFEAAAERYNDAKYRLAQIERRLAEANELRRAAEAKADAAERRLADRAVEAYLGTGSQVDGLLDADTLAEFSDRLEFMGAVAQNDAALALEARNARQQAEWAAARYREVVAERRRQVESIQGELDRLERLIDDQEELAARLERERADYLTALAAQRAALEQAREGAASSPPPPSSYVPPPNGSAAEIAVQAAYSIVGTPYVWGSANPSVGLDCSGVTVYAWGQAGVSLPHSAQAQYSMFPRIPLSAVQPGDLVYYGNYGPHIAIYVGGGNIIHASSPAPGGQARIDSMYGYDEPWGAVRVT
jgi:cell wall-associated NlpC family hydrolase